MPKPICCSSLVLDVLDSHKLVLDRGGHHPALVCAAPRAAQTCAFGIWIQIQRPNSKFLYFLLVRVTRVILVFWQFGPSGTANRIKSSVNVPSGRAVVRAQRAIP